MPSQAHIKDLITTHQERLQILRKQEALQGFSVDPKIVLEIRHIEAEINTLQAELQRLRKRVFVSYRRNTDPDELVALQIVRDLSQEHDVFIDQMMPAGTQWAERIDAELSRSDFLITLLSAQSVHSEMVLSEVARAHELARASGGRPVILPVRLAYREPFQYPLKNYLDEINWAFWEDHPDTPRLIAELIQAVAGQPLNLDAQLKAKLLQVGQPPPIPQPAASAQPQRLERPEGTMDPESAFYIERPGDKIALEAIAGQGITITIKAPRQMGKSSLLIRTVDRALKLGKSVAFLDFQLFDKSALADADLFFAQFCLWLSDELGITPRVDEYWQNPLGNTQRCTRYVSRYLLKEVGEPVVLALDEVENVFDTEFRSDFFSMLRHWHNNRSHPVQGRIWKQLDLILVTSTEPYQLIENLNQSPFNVGEIIEATDFTAAQVADLNRRHGTPLTAQQEQQLINLVGGHPYLVRKALYLTANQHISPPELFSQATRDRGPFGDHLRHHLFRLNGKTELIDGFRQVIHHHTYPSEEIFFRLRGAGLVRREGDEVLPRCQLYEAFFRERLDG